MSEDINSEIRTNGHIYTMTCSTDRTVGKTTGT